jgi:FkbM family methyltransferase
MASTQPQMFSVALCTDGEPVRFAVDDPADEIQSYLLRGVFYERDQLDYHQTLIPRKGRVLDLGANIGNHAVYYAVMCGAEIVVSVEPNERSWRLFRQTLDWNSIDSIELVSGIAAGAGEGWATLDQGEANRHNLGGTSVRYHLEPMEGSVPVRTGDAILAGRPVDFIKIDVEGSELKVLTGLQSTIDTHAPAIAVEVMPDCRDAFAKWCDSNAYRIERTFHMYRGIFNYVCLPRA